MPLPKSFTDLVEHLTILPGVGEKTAERFVYSLYEKDYDEVMGPSINIGTVWRLASKDLNDALMEKLNQLLVNEIPAYYKNICSK